MVKYSKNRVVRTRRILILVLVDFIAVLVAGFFGNFLIRGEFDRGFLLDIVVLGVVDVFTGLLVKFYKPRLSDGSAEIAVRGFSSVFISTLIMVIAAIVLQKDFISHIVVSQILFYCLSCGYRFIYRMIVNTVLQHSDSTKKAIIYGAGDLGSTLARQAQNGKLPYRIVGFVDDKEELVGDIIIHYQVLGTSESLLELIKEYKIETVIIAITEISSAKIQNIAGICSQTGCDLKIIPALFESKQRADVPVRDIDMADLLGRTLNTVERKPLEEFFEQKTVLVTGAGGSIGSEICNQLMTFDIKKLIVLDIDETELHDLCLRLLDYSAEWSEKVVPVVCNIKNAGKVSKIMQLYKPNIVFHAAAYKHVPLMEKFPEEAAETNICGSYNVFKACSEAGVEKTVVISTDKAVNPTNVMGATKRVVELMAQSFDKNSNTRFCCVRFGNVIGSRGSMLPLFLEEIKAGRDITVTDKRIVRYFMAIPEAVGLVFRAATVANGGEIMVLDMGEPVKIYDFAQKLIALYGDGRTKIKITGLRPGEKLYEELLANKDTTEETGVEKVFKAKVLQDARFTNSFMEELVADIPLKTSEQIRDLLVELVPEFQGSKQ